jgi:3-oxoacyl-[acyl-carrier-protein] synthase-1
MAKVNILSYEINSAQGNLRETLDAVKQGRTQRSLKRIQAPLGEVEIPYYLLKEEIRQEQESIYEALRSLVAKIIPSIEESKRSATALVIGTSLVDWYLVDAINASVYESEKKPYASQKRSIDSYAKALSGEFGLSDFTMTINTACTSSANAMLEASNMIDIGVFEYAIVVGVEIFSPIMSSGFYAMDLIAEHMVKPFDLERDGLVLGEAVAAILLGKENAAWSLEGGFSNCNSQTITSVSQSGDECVEVMQKALCDSGVEAKEITALKAHATGSYSNDLAELNAISRVFDPSLLFTALKPYVGHTIGASGVLEIALLMAAVDDGFIPKTHYCEAPLHPEYRPLTEHKPCQEGIFMCNYFGFGGNNISLIIKKVLP